MLFSGQRKIRGEYDIVYSLGAPCQVAEQMKRHQLRLTSGPFDWTVLESVPQLIRALDTRFEGYFAKENLEIRERGTDGWLVWDKGYEVMSVHDFPLTESEEREEILQAYPAFQEKLKRRIDRFYDRVSKSGMTLFIRYHGSREDTERLSECLDRLTGGKYRLLMLNETKERAYIEENWKIPNTYAARICQAEDIPWQGCGPHWDRALKGVRVKAAQQDESLKEDPNI